MSVGITRSGPIDNNSVELRLHGGGDDRLPRQFLRRFIPRLFFYNAALNCLRQQLSDFIAFQGNELIIGVELIELGTKIQGMNAWIISFQDQEVFRSQEKVIFLYDFSFQRRHGDPEFLSRGTDDGPGLQYDDPVVLRDVVRMDRDVVTRHFSSEDTHLSRVPDECWSWIGAPPWLMVWNSEDADLQHGEGTEPGSEVNRLRRGYVSARRAPTR